MVWSTGVDDAATAIGWQCAGDVATEVGFGLDLLDVGALEGGGSCREMGTRHQVLAGFPVDKDAGGRLVPVDPGVDEGDCAWAT
jgi:hypothetical protein